MNYERVQILLEPRQYQALKQAARQAQKSVSELVREMMDKYLLVSEQDEMLEALNALRVLREKQSVYQGDPVNESRTERERQIDDWLKRL